MKLSWLILDRSSSNAITSWTLDFLFTLVFAVQELFFDHDFKIRSLHEVQLRRRIYHMTLTKKSHMGYRTAQTNKAKRLEFRRALCGIYGSNVISKQSHNDSTYQLLTTSTHFVSLNSQLGVMFSTRYIRYSCRPQHQELDSSLSSATALLLDTGQSSGPALGAVQWRCELERRFLSLVSIVATSSVMKRWEEGPRSKKSKWISWYWGMIVANLVEGSFWVTRSENAGVNSRSPSSKGAIWVFQRPVCDHTIT